MTTSISERRTALYRFFDEDGALLYIGITVNPRVRWRDHAGRTWWPDVATKTLEWHTNRADAEAAEREAIRVELPRYNVSPGLHPPEHRAFEPTLSPAELRAMFREDAKREVAKAPKLLADDDLADIKALCRDFPAFLRARHPRREPGTAA